MIRRTQGERKSGNGGWTGLLMVGLTPMKQADKSMNDHLWRGRFVMDLRKRRAADETRYGCGQRF